MFSYRSLGKLEENFRYQNTVVWLEVGFVALGRIDMSLRGGTTLKGSPIRPIDLKEKTI